TTRVYSLEATSGFNDSSGPIRRTGGPLDMAVMGPGWFAAKSPDGQEVYTRSGAFTLGPEGTLLTPNGYPVVGDGGELVIPENAHPIIASDGTVSAQVGDGLPVQVGRLKLVNPPAEDLKKFSSGFLVTKSGQPAQADEAVRITSGSLEGSNVNVVESMVGMIAVSRQFEMQMRMIQNAESNETRAATILSRNS
ncbi:MAG: flagellar basal body rod protein FlgF, partial [Burkholderiaceae bacterium]